MKYLIALLAALTVVSCTTTENILSGSSHACGTLHVEGYFTDTQGEVRVVKAPADWDATQIAQFCGEDN